MTTPATPGQEQAAGMDSTGTVTARYLAPGGAHVIVTRRIEDDDASYTVDCQACGSLRSDLNYTEHYRQERAEQTASRHAAGCRRIPERLWREDGAS